MKSAKHGTNTSKVEVVGITMNGIWLHVNEMEYFLPFEDYPWFQEAKLGDIPKVELLHGHHLRWDKLDIDIELESLTNIEKYPLKYQR
ncbi:MAG: DUF2442 domain-containing protein [Cyanobacteria bacterium]|nr:DUF2442 domain-containing protein [Cyanobacteriota bacterium]MDA1020562.1 DUF2442 domain-containing protein [Cyanobacteriota bacterium]